MISVRPEIPRARSFLWTVLSHYEENVRCYLDLFQEVPEDHRAVANILKDLPKDLQPVELLRVAGAYLLEFLEGRHRVSPCRGWGLHGSPQNSLPKYLARQ